MIEDGKLKDIEDFKQVEARNLFNHPNVYIFDTDFKLKLGEPNEEGLIQLLVEENTFNRETIEKSLKKLKSFDRSTRQMRIGDFFNRKTPDKAKIIFEENKIENKPKENEKKDDKTSKTKEIIKGRKKK